MVLLRHYIAPYPIRNPIALIVGLGLSFVRIECGTKTKLTSSEYKLLYAYVLWRKVHNWRGVFNLIVEVGKFQITFVQLIRFYRWVKGRNIACLNSGRKILSKDFHHSPVVSKIFDNTVLDSFGRFNNLILQIHNFISRNILADPSYLNSKANYKQLHRLR